MTEEQSIDVGLVLWQCGLEGYRTFQNLTTLCEHTATHMTACRYELLKRFQFNHVCVEHMTKIGPNGTEALKTLFNQGKTLNGGHYRATSVLPHYNPLKCHQAAMGALFVWRFRFMSEPFPDFRDPASWYHRPLYRTGRNYKDAMTYDTAYGRFKALYQQEGIICGKVCHEGRVKCLQDFQRAQLLQTQVDKFVGQDYSVRTTFYELEVPQEPQVHCGGGDHEDLRSFEPPQSKVDVDEGVEVLFPEIKHGLGLIGVYEQQIASDVGSKKKFETLCLVSAKGFLNGLKQMGRSFIRAAASKPLDGNGNLMTHLKPLFELCPNNRLFRLDFFTSQIFKTIVVEVQEVQLAHHVGRFMQLSGRALKDQKEHERAHAQHQVMAHWATQVATEVCRHLGVGAAGPRLESAQSGCDQPRVQQQGAGIETSISNTLHPGFIQSHESVQTFWEEYDTKSLRGVGLREIEDKTNKAWRKHLKNHSVEWEWRLVIWKAMDEEIQKGLGVDAMVAKFEGKRVNSENGKKMSFRQLATCLRRERRACD